MLDFGGVLAYSSRVSLLPLAMRTACFPTLKVQTYKQQEWLSLTLPRITHTGMQVGVFQPSPSFSFPNP